jgi:large subunit ribosomal protein L17
MVHRKKGRKLKRTASHRSALLSNLSISLILNKRIKTTEAKAKELRRFIEPLVSKAKKALKFKDSAPEKGIHLRREARKFLNNKEALIILFDEIGQKVGDRPGGYTRVLKTGHRYGDGAQTAIIEFVDYNYVKEKEDKIKEKEDKTKDKDEKGADKTNDKARE